MAEKRTIKRFSISVLALGVFVLLLWFFSVSILTMVGQFLICDQKPVASDVIVVLYTGVEYYPRLVEAANLYEKGYARKVVINGNRKTDALRSIEARGFAECCPWYENYVRILGIFGVPRKDIIPISAEDAYDTMSEAEAVGKEIIDQGYQNIIITSSKFHTRRAAFIWRNIFKDRLTVRAVAATEDTYDPSGWWKQGRQIRWVLAEYGAWLFYWWKQVV